MADLGSHQFLDDFALAYHRAVAERLRVLPEPLIQRARDNLARWERRGEMSSAALLSLHEWERILEESSVEQLITLITEESDDGQRLRQSTPFVGTLTKEERRELLAECEKRASHQSGPPRE